MLSLLDEDPEAFVGRSTPEEWEQQVDGARMEISARLIKAVNTSIEQVESMLHDGQFRR
jgi:hypothetical protein